MSNLLNVPEVLTYQPVPQTFILAPGQVYLRGGPTAQPFLGAVRDRPVDGQVWPRGEYQSDKAVGTNAPAPPVLVATVVVTPSEATLDIGGGALTAQLTATTYDVNGNVLTGRSIVWVSSNPAKATVSATGLVTAVAVGSATISAISEGQVGTCAVTVLNTPPAVASVTVNPATWARVTGQTIQLTTTLRDASSHILTGRTVTWATSNAGVATVSASGLVTAVAPGSVTITATSETIPGTSVGTVSDPPVIPPSIVQLYWPMDENVANSITSADAGHVELISNASGSHTAVEAAAKKNAGRKMTTGAGLWIPNGADIQMPGNHDWSLAVWFNLAVGSWGADFAYLIGTTNAIQGVAMNFRFLAGFLANRFAVNGNDAGWGPSDCHAGWNHLAVTNDVANNRLKTYLNGVEQRTTLAINFASVGDGIIHWNRIGNAPSISPAEPVSTWTRSWGSMDELYIYDRVFTPAEITTLASI